MKNLDRLSSLKSYKAAAFLGVVTALISCITLSCYYENPMGTVIFFVVAPLFFLFWEECYLAENFLKKGAKKIIFSDIVDVRKFLFWRIIVDEYGDSVWINYKVLKPEDKVKLDEWLRL